MIKRATHLLGFALMAPFIHAQAYGLLLGARTADLHAAGVSFAPGHGLTAGVFVPFYVNDRLVVRAEAGLTGLWTRNSDGETALPAPRLEADLSILCRYYIARKVSLGLGIQGIKFMEPTGTLIVNKEECRMNATDLCLLFSAAYRFSERMEAGLRYGQGLLPAADLSVYGAAHRRYGQFTMSYLLHTTNPGFAERRKWRSGLELSQRY